MFSKLLIVMTAALATVNAQSSSVPSLDACILACIQPAATQNGCVYTDVTCVCTSAQFQADAGACLIQHCTSTDLTAAMALQGAECAALSLSATATASVTPNPVSFSLASSGTATGTVTGTVSGTATSGTTTPTITTPTTSGSPTTATTPTGTTGTTAGTTAAAPTTTSKSAASSLVANSGVGALVAIIAGFLAL